MKPQFGLQWFLSKGAVLLLVTITVLSSVTCQPPSFVSNWTTTPSSEWLRSQTVGIPQKNMERKLKICGDSDILKKTIGDKVAIPTFSVDRLTYDMEEYEIDNEDLRTTCFDDPEPVIYRTSVITLLSKALYDTEKGEEQEFADFSIEFSLLLLRSESLLLHDGFLSVGDSEADAVVFYPPGEYCLAGLEGNGPEAIYEFRTCSVSRTRPVFRKCCPVGMVIGATSCESYTPTPPEAWHPLYMEADTNSILPFHQVNPVVIWPQLTCKNGTIDNWSVDQCSHEFHPMTDNRVAFVGAFRTWEYFSNHINWCMDIRLNDVDVEHPEKLTLYFCSSNATRINNAKTQIKVSILYAVNMYVGAGFHLLTSLVYLITWRGQNIHGKTLCSCTASLFFMQMCLGTTHLLGLMENHLQTELCLAISVGGQYFFIAAFTWLLVVNFDLWRTFRTIRPGNNQMNDGWFWGYSSLGWGFPCVVSAISLSLNFTFPCRTSRIPTPEFGQHEHCFVAPWAQGIYVYYILSVLIAISCVFAGWTLISLSRIKKKTTSLRTNKQDANKQTVRLFFKLSVIMGFSWIFEVIGWAATRQDENYLVWIILDFYNALSAILIFYIFVCKPATLILLEQAVPPLKGLSAAVDKMSLCSNGDKKSSAKKSRKEAEDAEVTAPIVKYTKDISESGASGEDDGVGSN